MIAEPAASGGLIAMLRSEESQVCPVILPCDGFRPSLTTVPRCDSHPWQRLSHTSMINFSLRTLRSDPSPDETKPNCFHRSEERVKACNGFLLYHQKASLYYGQNKYSEKKKKCLDLFFFQGLILFLSYKHSRTLQRAFYFIITYYYVMDFRFSSDSVQNLFIN